MICAAKSATATTGGTQDTGRMKDIGTSTSWVGTAEPNETSKSTRKATV